MIIKTLTLKNYRKFRDTVIEFPDGVTGVIGLNGVGKSTIFEAVAWVLYGPVAARTPADEIKREGAETLDHCRVELEFVFEDDEYRIVREMSGKSLSTSASALVNGKLAASGAETVNKYVQKKLGMDFKSFFTSIFAKQKELNALSSMNASERRPLILKMLGIDSLDEVIKEIKSDKRHKGALVEKLSLDLVDETGGNKIEKYRSEIEKLENKSEKTNLLIMENKEKIKLFNKELKALEKDYLSRKIEYERINHLKEKFEEKKTLFENKKNLIEEINNLRDKIVVREKNVGKHRKKILEFENLEQKIKNVESRLDKTDEATYTIVKKIEQKKTFIESIKISIKRIEYKRKKIEKTGPDANCPTCEKILGDQYSKLLSKLDKEKFEKDKEIKSFLKDINTEKIIYEKACREKQALEKKRKYLQSQLREKERIDTTIRNVFVEVKGERKEIEEKEKRLKKLGEVKFDLKEYDFVKKEVKEFYSKYQSLLDLLGEKKDKLGNIKLELEKNVGEKKLIIHEIKNLNDKISELREFEKRIKEGRISVQYIKMLEDVMSSFRLHLISRIRPALSSYASDYFGRLTDGKYQEIELDDNYEIMVYDGGNLYGIERFSGGEEDLANLCLRLAISEIITERAGGLFNFIILDEIFGSQDMVRRQNIMKSLNNLSSKFRQIFLITHIEDIKNYMENVILVGENEDGISTIKIE